jgi:hypothetical protein
MRRDWSHLNKRTGVLCVCYWSYRLIFLSYACDNLYIDYINIIYWQHTGEDDTKYTEFLLLCRAFRRTRYVGHQMTRTNRRLGSLNTQGGFGKLGRTILLYGGHPIPTTPVHRQVHHSVHLRAALYMRIGLARWRYCCGLRLIGMTH